MCGTWPLPIHVKDSSELEHTSGISCNVGLEKWVSAWKVGDCVEVSRDALLMQAVLFVWAEMELTGMCAFLCCGVLVLRLWKHLCMLNGEKARDLVPHNFQFHLRSWLKTTYSVFPHITIGKSFNCNVCCPHITWMWSMRVWHWQQ